MQKLKGLIAAPFTPMSGDGSLNLGMVAPYAARLKKDGVSGVFICGTTGEGMLMEIEERMAVAEQWIKEQNSDFKVIVHVGTTSYVQSKKLARHAQQIGAYAIGCMGPIFLKPGRMDDLVKFCSEVASGAPELPFYYYHIPTVSDIWLPMPEFLKKAQLVIPNLAGIKFTHRNMMEMLLCINADGGKWDILHGFDEELLCGLSMGAQAAIGSTYNYMPTLYLKLIDAFQKGDMDAAREYQLKSVRFIEILIRYGGGVIGGKPIMKMVGLDCGPLRAPAHNLSADEFKQYEKELIDIGFFDWLNGKL
ncbi:MAG: dihydrodipicolinate synthase family protein [Prolixibacteraceae bacterium]|nr:dihydrodipicolinate synthase family protein [Prolixibacteraceae bacterium]